MSILLYLIIKSRLVWVYLLFLVPLLVLFLYETLLTKKIIACKNELEIKYIFFNKNVSIKYNSLEKVIVKYTQDSYFKSKTITFYFFDNSVYSLKVGTFLMEEFSIPFLINNVPVYTLNNGRLINYKLPSYFDLEKYILE